MKPPKLDSIRLYAKNKEKRVDVYLSPDELKKLDKLIEACGKKVKRSTFIGLMINSMYDSEFLNQ